MTAADKAFTLLLSEMTDAELEACTGDYIWFAESAPEPGLQLKRNLIVVECERRGRPDIIRRIREPWSGPVRTL